MKLVLIRHGESVWNQENKFTGWTDVDLSDNGKKEAHEAGKSLKNMNMTFDKAYTSKLKRARNTLDIVLEELNTKLPIEEYQNLNERHYGSLQGMNKDEARSIYGEEQVRLWRRSYDIKPPEGESLKDTLDRVKEVYDNNIKKDLIYNKDVLIVAHGNSLRALVKILENISDEDIINLEIPTGKPIIYILDNNLTILEKTAL